MQGLLQAIVAALAGESSGTFTLERVGTASAWTGPSHKDAQGILNDVYDASTGTLRIVEV